MFSKARNLIANIAAVDLNSAFINAVAEPDISKSIVTENIRQLGISETVIGEPLGVYADDKAQLNLKRGKEPGTPIDLLDTGEFYDSISIEPEGGDGFSIYGDTIKVSDNGNIPTDLVDRYGQILGLSDESKHNLLPMLQDGMLRDIRTQL